MVIILMISAKKNNGKTFLKQRYFGIKAMTLLRYMQETIKEYFWFL